MVGFNCHVFEDGSFKVNQYAVEGSDPTLFFGPLQAKLSDLFAMGFILQMSSYVKKTTYGSSKVHLIRGKEKYLVGKISNYALRAAHTKPVLQSVIKDGMQLMGKASTDSYDPFQQLERKYPPINKKKTVMIGNQTVRQYVEANL